MVLYTHPKISVSLLTAFFFFSILFSGISSAATITVENVSDSVTADDLVNILLGDNSNVSVSNISITGSNAAIGNFTNGGSLGFDTGVVMSTGLISNISNDMSNFANTNNSQPGDSDLSTLVNDTTFDAIILEFDFIPEKSGINFNYRFSSEESFIDVYDDAFGLFVNGENIALLPNGNPVSVINIGNGSYYEPGPLNNCFNGSSIILTATAEVVPDTLNHMKFAIADARDGVYDSGVFIEGGSFVSNTIPNAPASPLCEGETNPANITDLTPEFSWTFSDPDDGDTQGAYQIQVGTSENGSDIWDSGQVTSSSSANISYAGSNLNYDTTYYWRVKTWDNNNAVSSYCAAQTFSTAEEILSPIANLTANVTSGTAPLTVNFTDLSTNTPTSWSWDFGDGSTSNDQNPTHTYTSGGTYAVSLSATNTAGSNTSIQTDYITVVVATTVNASYTSVAYTENDNITVDFGINVTGSSTFTSARVYIGDGYVEGEDFLRFTNTSNITGSFNSLTGILSLSGSGNATTYQEAFRNVRYENTNDDPNTSDRNITFVMGDYAIYLESTGHYYESIHSESAITWAGAKAAAEARSLSGMQGYLATILSEEESVFLGSKAPDNAWMGANDAAVEGEWRWVAGPENTTGLGTLFYYQGNGTTLPGFYTNWNNNEPNDEDGEDCGQILGNSDEKKWNDLPNAANVFYYLVEYGGMPDEPTPQLTATITVNVNSVNDAPSMPGNFTNPLHVQSVERGSTINVTWGESTDLENDSIVYDLWFYNETWTHIANSLSINSYMFTIPFDNVSEVMLKVYANDSVTNSSENNVTFNLTSITPGISFTANVTSGSVPLTVNFTDLSSHYPTVWEWDFGDGNTSTDQSPIHTYYGPGNYNVSLNASNLGGYNISIQTAYITATSVPVASFSSNVTSGAAPLSVSFTDLSTNEPTSWLWNFGDGNTSTEQTPNHTYIAAGTYTVSLNATNAAGSDTTSEANYIHAAVAPVSGFSADVTSGAVPLAVEFTDQSTNIPTSWLWNFGDGQTSTEQNPTHTYVAAGSYTVSLNATNAGGSDTTTETNYIRTAVAPVSSFIVNVTSGAVPLTVEFTDQSTNTPTSWLWNFGDGQTSTEQNPVHTYASAGTYTVSMNATNIGGSDTTTQTEYIHTAVAPIANFTVNAFSGSTPFAATFTDLSTNEPTSWLWNFGDGQTSTEQNPVHTYITAGTYTVSLNTTNAGGSNTATQANYITATRRSSSSSSGSSSGSSSTYVSNVNVSESIISEESNASTNVGSSENSGDQPVQKIQNNDTSEIYSEKRNAESSSNSSIAITGGLLLVTGSLIFVVFRKK